MFGNEGSFHEFDQLPFVRLIGEETIRRSILPHQIFYDRQFNNALRFIPFRNLYRQAIIAIC